MRHAALLLLIAISGARAAAGDPDPRAVAPHMDVRKELLSEFRYAPPSADPAQVRPFLLAAPPAQTAASEPDSPGLLKMAPFTVREMVRMETLHADILQEKADGRTAMIMSRLGVGLHVAPVGPVALYAATIFYIPFVAGFAFSF